MPVYHLQLQLRPEYDHVTLPVSQLRAILERRDGEGLLQAFGRLQSDNQAAFMVHDKVWLAEIIRWRPRDGLPAQEAFSRKKLFDAIQGIDPDREGTFQLTRMRAEVLWNIIKHPEFKLQSVSSSFLEFLEHFQEVTGFRFDGIPRDPDLDEIEKASSA